MSSSGTWDVVVAGAGPAGSATAIRLARAGWRVLLTDRARFPRRKPCGECINPAAVAALDALGALPQVLAAGANPLRGWRIHARRGHRFTGGFSGGREALGLPREVLDALLLKLAARAGAEVRTGMRVTQLRREAAGMVTGVVVHDGASRQMVPARLVIGADGLRSTIVRQLGLIRRAPRLRKLALAAHVEGLAGLGSYGELHALADGCIGAAAVGGGIANVTVVVGCEAGAAVAGRAGEFFDESLARHPRFANAARVDQVLATGPFDWPVRRAAAGGVLLVGDAAGYYDPFTGEGIFRALRGAELAAAAAGAALLSGDVSAAALLPYDRALRGEFAHSVGLQHLIEAVVAREPLLGRAVHLLQRSPSFATALIDATGNVAAPSTLLSPRLMARAVRESMLPAERESCW